MLAIELFGHRVDPRSNRVLDGYPKNKMGLELEWDDCHVPEAMRRKLTLWSVHHEGSLSEHGIELVFDHPYMGEDIKRALDQIEDIKESVNRVDSPNHSTHCHVDCRDLTINELIHFMIGATLVEPMLFKSFGDGRQKNIFCLSSDTSMGGYTVGIGRLLARLKMGQSVVGDAYLQLRYNGINYGALEKFGSIEFRQGNVMYEPVKMLEFMNFLDDLKEFCRIDTDPLSDYEEFIQRIIQRYYGGDGDLYVGKMVAVVEMMLESMWQTMRRRSVARARGRQGPPFPRFTTSQLEGFSPEEVVGIFGPILPPMSEVDREEVTGIPSELFEAIYPQNEE